MRVDVGYIIITARMLLDIDLVCLRLLVSKGSCGFVIGIRV